MIKLKSEKTSDMLVYDIQHFQNLSIISSPGGVQPKYTDGKLWIKPDSEGYRGLSEVISSRFAGPLGVSCVKYEPCYLSDGEILRSGCVSQSYISEHQTESSVGAELCAKKGFLNLRALTEFVTKLPTIKERISYVVESLSPEIPEAVMYEFLANTLWIDSCIYNPDRHLCNLILLREGDTLIPGPLMDFGEGLMADTYKYPERTNYEVQRYNIKSKPFATAFRSQVNFLLQYLGFGLPKDITILKSDLFLYYEPWEIARAIDILELGLKNCNITLHTY